MSDLNANRVPMPLLPHEPTLNNVDMSGTDLPLSLRGRGGSINESAVPCERCPHLLLYQALAAVPSAPLDDTSRAAAYRWLAEVQQGLIFRRERRMLANAVSRALSEEFHSRRHIESIRRSIERARARESDKDAGIYWTFREAGRAAQRPVRVEVDPHVWEAFKRRAERGGTTVGELLGRLATDAAAHGEIGAAASSWEPRRLLFLRIAIDDSTWLELRHLTRSAGWTTARFLGALAERHEV